jgi:benzoyl-CoA reductase/2-hydroxyglutaryl-CoA dehydratase subunit BcrC/BadD/HgdB
MIPVIPATPKPGKTKISKTKAMAPSKKARKASQLSKAGVMICNATSSFLKMTGSIARHHRLVILQFPRYRASYFREQKNALSSFIQQKENISSKSLKYKT